MTAGVGLCYSQHDLQLLRVLCNQKHIICACRTTTVDVSYPLTKAVHSKFQHEAVNIHLVETSRNDTSLSNTLEHLEAITQTTFPFDFGSETRVKFPNNEPQLPVYPFFKEFVQENGMVYYIESFLRIQSSYIERLSFLSLTLRVRYELVLCSF